MARSFRGIFRTREYKGRAIRGASYEIGAGSWAPEACFSQYTENGWRQLWVQSFSHLVGPRGVKFATQKEADEYAFCLARTLIDRIAPEFEKPARRELLRLGRRRAGHRGSPGTRS